MPLLPACACKERTFMPGVESAVHDGVLHRIDGPCHLMDKSEQEWDLIGLVCDQIDRANPDLPIEVCQAIAKDIIQLVRERT